MGKSTVYFTDFRCPVGTSQLDKLKKVCLAAGIKNIDMDGKFVAIKMHFGVLGNLAFLRPNYAKAVADLCKAQGGVPFLTDCNRRCRSGKDASDAFHRSLHPGAESEYEGSLCHFGILYQRSNRIHPKR